LRDTFTDSEAAREWLRAPNPYLGGLTPADGEVYRHVTPKLLPSLNDYRLSELFVRVEAVLDRRDPAPLELRFKISYMTPTTRPRRQSGLRPSPMGWKG
jgi:hypothetical protein